MFSIPFIEVTVIAVAYTIFALAIQRVLVDVDKMYDIRAKMNTKTKDVMAMMKTNNDPKVLAEKQKEITALSMESMKAQFKSMFVILPVFVLLYYVGLPPLLKGVTAKVTLLSFKLSYQTYFFVLAFIIGIALSGAASLYDRRRLKHKYNFGITGPSLKAEEQASAN